MTESNRPFEIPDSFNLIFKGYNDSHFELKFPRRRFTFINIYSIFFGIFGFSFLIFLSVKFSEADFPVILIAFISLLLFSYILLKLTIGNIIYIFENQILTIERDKFTLEKKLFNSSSIVSGEISSIESIRLKNSPVKFKNYFVLNPRLLFLSLLKQSEKMGSFDIPVMNIDDKEVMFFEALKYDEQKWIVDTLNEYICSVKH